MALFSSLVFIAQCLGLLKEYDVAFPRSVDRILDALDLTNFNLSALAPGCTDKSVNFYRSFVASACVPPAILLTCGAVYWYAEQSRRRHYADFPNRARTEYDAFENLKRRCVRNSIWMLTLAYSGTAKTTFQLYNARRLDIGSFLRRDYSIGISDGISSADGSGKSTYRVFSGFGIIALALYPLGIPLFILRLLRKGSSENKLEERVFQQKYGFLYAAYKNKFVAWELAGLTLKCFLAAVPVFATESTLRARNSTTNSGYDIGAGGGFALACQSTLAQAGCLLILVAILWLRPHKESLHSAQQSAAVAIVLGWILILGNILNVDSGNGDSDGSSAKADSAARSSGTSTVAFDEEEKFRVCFAAVAATLAAVLAMVAGSFFAGEFDAVNSSASEAVISARASFKRLASRLKSSGSYASSHGDDAEIAENGKAGSNKTGSEIGSPKPHSIPERTFSDDDADLRSSVVEVSVIAQRDKT